MKRDENRRDALFEVASEHDWRLAPDDEHHQWAFWKKGFHTVVVTFAAADDRVVSVELGPVLLGRNTPHKAHVIELALKGDALRIRPGVEIPPIAYQPPVRRRAA